MHKHQSVDNSDWLKTMAIILVVIDHIGYFFIEDADWWSVLGRLAAPSFFFLLGYAQTKAVPFHWIWLAVILTLLDSWNTDWDRIAPNILFSLAFIRIVRPYVLIFMQNYGWLAFIFLVVALFGMLPIATNLVDYGAEGWLWAVFGLCQRLYMEEKLPTNVGETAQKVNLKRMRLLAGFVATVIYIWQEQQEFLFSQIHFIAFVIGISILTLSLNQFLRGLSSIQPPKFIANLLCFIGRHTLEIYAIQLAGSELLIQWMPNLSP